MTDEQRQPTPEEEAIAQVAAQDQATAALRGLAEAVVVARKTLVAGGMSDGVADQMMLRFWLQMFPMPQPQNPLGFLFGGSGQPPNE